MVFWNLFDHAYSHHSHLYKKTEIGSDQLILNATFTLLMHLESAFQISYLKQGINSKGIHATSIGLPHKPHIKFSISKNKQIHPQYGMQHISHGKFSLKEDAF